MLKRLTSGAQSSIFICMQPRLTVVRKHSTASSTLGEGSLGSSLGASLGTSLGGGASTACDGDLPSVMTCVFDRDFPRQPWTLHH